MKKNSINNVNILEKITYIDDSTLKALKKIEIKIIILRAGCTHKYKKLECSACGYI